MFTLFLWNEVVKETRGTSGSLFIPSSFVPVEVQIRTEAMDMWASLEHDIKYKSLYQDIGVDFTGELLECSKLIYQAEEKMEYMNNVLEG